MSRAVWLPTLLLTCLGLQGCTESPLNPWAWLGASWAASMAVALGGAALAYRAGRQRSHSADLAALREARFELRQWQDIQDGWTWRSDALHQLTAWRAAHSGNAAAPAALPSLPDTDRSLVSLFSCAAVRAGTEVRAEMRAEMRAETTSHPAVKPTPSTAPGAPAAAPPATRSPTLAHTLAAQRAFQGLRVECKAAPHFGAQAWLLSASPSFDVTGRFEGYVGSARPLDADDALHADAAALLPLLALHPAVLLVDLGAGWTVRHASPSAHSRWPAARAGAPAALWLRALPAVIAQTLHTLQSGQRVEVEGWRLSGFDLPGGVGGVNNAGGARGVLLATVASANPATSSAIGSSPDTAENDNFAITVSHDLRAPIRVVDGFTRIVKEDYGHLLDRVCNDHLDRVLGAAARMNLMIDALLTLARLSSQPLAHQPVNLSQLASYVMDDLKRSTPERDIDIDIEPDLAAQGDPTLLRLVLENLLGNAWKYTARCPRAQISVRRFEHAGSHAFEVRDNGAGFDMRSAERLFGLFQRLHSANDFPGHGVGLASVKRIISRHGGDIWAEAEPGRGAVFRFTLAD